MSKSHVVKLLAETNENTTTDSMISTQRAETQIVQNATFSSDIPITVNDIGPIVDIPYPLKAGPHENREHSIKDFLSRPVVCTGCSVAWASTATANTDLISMNVPGAMLGQLMIAEKLSGFFGFRATAVVRIQVNPQRFQQGILLLNVVPIPVLIGNRLNQINAHLMFKTQLPSVRMNIASDSEIVMRIPFVSPQNFYERNNNQYDWAEFRTTVYVPLNTGSVQVTCWCHFEDLELVFPIAQSGIFGKSVRKARRYDASDEETPTGILSTSMMRFSQGFGELSKVPLLSQVAAPTSWFAAAASRAFAAFGFSNPITPVARTAVVPKITSHSNQVDVTDTCDSHGLFISNKVATLPGFAGTDIDEMSFDYILRIPAYFTTYNWTTSNTAGTSIWSQQVSPQHFFQQYTVLINSVATTMNATLPISYFAAMFQYWRGSIRFRFLIAKTEFHSGRLLITFNPSPTATTVAQVPYTYKWVWDVRESNEFEVEIPFVSSVPWRQCQNIFDSIGIIQAIILNTLVAPPTVSTSISLIVEVSSGDDFQFAVPLTESQLLPVLAYGPDNNTSLMTASSTDFSVRKSRAYLNTYEDDIIAQGPGTQVLSRDNLARTSENTDKINPSGSPSDQGASCLYTIGETFSSLRQILKRSVLFLTPYALAATDLCFTMSPFQVNLPSYIGGTTAGVLPVASFALIDYYDWIVPLYAMRRGGVITRVIGNSNSAQLGITSFLSNTTTNIPANAKNTSGTRNVINWTNNTLFSSTLVQGALESHIPYYSQTHSTPVYVYPGSFANSSTSPFVYDNNLLQNVIVTSGTSSTNAVSVTRQVADDFHLGFFIGTLPLYGFVSTVPTYPL
jgi:hypothetical protein